MKRTTLFSAFLLFYSLILAQNVTVETLGTLLSPPYISTFVEQNADNILIGATTTPNYDNGKLILYKKNTSDIEEIYHWNFCSTTNDPGFSVAQVSMTEQNIFVYYADGLVGWNDFDVMALVSTSNNEPTVSKSIMNAAIIDVTNDGENYFLTIYMSEDTDPLDFDFPQTGVPGIFTACLSGEDLSVIYCTRTMDYHITEDLQWMPDGNLALKVIYEDQHSELHKIDSQTGEDLGMIASGSKGMDYVFYSDSEGDYLSYHGVITGGENYQDTIYEQKWEWTDFWPKKDNVHFYPNGDIVVFNGDLCTFSTNTVISNEILLRDYFPLYMDVPLSSFLNEDNSADLIIDENGTIKLYRYTRENEFIPILLNPDGDGVYTTFDAQVFTDSWHDCTPAQSTLILNDEDFPEEGDETHQNWLMEQDGITFFGMAPTVESDEGGLFFRASFKYEGEYFSKINLKVYLKKKSEVDLSRATAGIAPQDLFTIYPNPAKDVIHISSQKNIEELGIYNILGQKIMDVKPQNMGAIDISTLNEGVYYLSVPGVSAQKLLIQR